MNVYSEGITTCNCLNSIVLHDTEVGSILACLCQLLGHVCLADICLREMRSVVQMYHWGYQYVENLTWVYMDANNTILTTPSDYAQKSHLTLFIFRKEGESFFLC